MINRFRVQYVDRPSGQVESERVVAAGFLDWSYNTRLGRLCTRALLARRWVSRLFGFAARRSVSRSLIAPFARFAGIRLQDFIRPEEGFRKFDQFFTRQLQPGARPQEGDDDVCTSPVDAKILVVENLEPSRQIRVKRSLFNLRRLVTTKVLADRYAGGTAIICRLCLSDYHHVHFPVSGIAGEARAVDGRLYACGPYASRWLVPCYADNYRMITVIDSETFGSVVVIEVGAFTVGSIRQHYRPGYRVCRGDHKAVFALGGSTVVLLFEAGAIQVDDDLRRHSARELETRVRCGESIGRLPPQRAHHQAPEPAR